MVRVRVGQPSIYNSCRFSFKYVLYKCPYRTNRQEFYIEGWLTLALTPSIIQRLYMKITHQTENSETFFIILPKWYIPGSFSQTRVLPLSGMVSRAATALMADLFSSSCFSNSCFTEFALALPCMVDLSGSISFSIPVSAGGENRKLTRRGKREVVNQDKSNK